MANVTFTLEELAGIYTKTFLKTTASKGFSDVGRIGAEAVDNFVAFVKQMEEDSK